MDKKFLHYYNLELQYLREMGEEFALENPKIAGRLGLSQFGCADPYVERLLEGFAYLAARVHYKLGEEFPRFTHSILNTVYPQYLMPTPSMAMVKFEPDLSEPDLAKGFTLPRDTALKSVVGKEDRTACEFRTAHDVTLWPLEIIEAAYEIGYRDTMNFGGVDNARANLRIRLKTPDMIPLGALELDALPFYIRDTKNDAPMRIYEQIFASCVGIVIQDTDDGSHFKTVLKDVKNCIKQVGFAKDQSLFPYDPRIFQAYRLIREYFAFPNRFMFFEVYHLKEAFKKSKNFEAHEIDIIFVFDRADHGLDKKITTAGFDLFCTPAVNLFSRRSDRIHLSKGAAEFHVLPDRTRVLDYEVMQIQEVLGYGPDNIEGDPFLPFYSSANFDDVKGANQAYYTSHRIPRSLTKREIERGARSSYIGSEVYLSLVDRNDAPYSGDLRELGVKALCSNRDLPIHMPVGLGKSDFTLDINVPADAVRCIEGPTEPKDSFDQITSNWNVINHLSLNYFLLLQSGDAKRVEVLRDILKLYCDPKAFHLQKQIDGIMDIDLSPVTRRIAATGPVAFTRGLEVMVTFNEDAFQGSGMFLLGSVIERFIGAYVRLNSFTETIINSQERGEVIRWPLRSGIPELM